MNTKEISTTVEFTQFTELRSIELHLFSIPNMIIYHQKWYDEKQRNKNKQYRNKNRNKNIKETKNKIHVGIRINNKWNTIPTISRSPKSILSGFALA